MMQLLEITQKLLFEHECVTIPRFGAFLTRTYKVSIKNETFYPPKKEVTFNALLISNDGIVAHYMAQKEKISFEHALRLIDKEVSSWKRKLHTQALIFPDIGEIRLNDSKKMEFSPYHHVNFDTKAFGLQKFTRKSLLINTPKQPKLITTMENKDKEKIMFTLDNKEAKKTPFLKYAAIGIIGIGLLGAIYYFGDQYVVSQQTKQTEIAQNKIKSTVQKATFDLGAIGEIELNINAKKNYISRNPSKISQAGSGFFSVIAGSFRSLENADRLTKELISQGYKAETISINEDGLYRVAYGRFSSKRDAINLLFFLRNSIKEDAWFLVE